MSVQYWFIRLTQQRRTEFGHRTAIPVINGVVIAAENEQAVLDQWNVDEEGRRKRDELKLERQALTTWRKCLMRLRVIRRVKEEYGSTGDAFVQDEVNPFFNQNNAGAMPWPISPTDPLIEHHAKALHDATSSNQFKEDGHNAGEGGFFLSDGEDDHQVKDSELVVESDALSQEPCVRQPGPRPPDPTTDRVAKEDREKDEWRQGDGEEPPKATRSAKDKSTLSSTAFDRPRNSLRSIQADAKAGLVEQRKLRRSARKRTASEGENLHSASSVR